MSDRFDVAILGGGLAGLTLARQVKLARPDTSIVVIEKRDGPAPDAAFKVGESTTEVGARYFAHIIGMKDHLDAEQIHKFGLRFFMSDGKNDDIARRIEMGIPFIPPDPSFQIDRGRFENELARRAAEDGTDVRGGSRVTEVEIGKGDEGHVVRVDQDGSAQEVQARWVVDAAGRANVLKKELGLEKDNTHNINSAWWRLDGGIVIDEWSDEDAWHERMPEEFRRKRMQSTNHLMGHGYWIWMIPLKSGPISVGICSDPRVHPWEDFETYDKCLAWLREHEPQLAAAHEGRDDQVLDFLRIENFSHGVERAFSPDRWAVTGDAGAFVDPLFSPGSNYIAFSNSFISDLIVHDLDGEDVTERAEAHNELYLRMYEMEIHPYQDFYLQMGNAQVAVGRITWGTIAYWSLTGVLYFHDNKLTDPEFMAEVRPHMERGWQLVNVMHEFFLQWNELDQTTYQNALVNMVEPQVDAVLYIGLFAEHDDEALKKQMATNVQLMESIAVALFHKGAELLPDASVPEDKKVNPYAISLKPERWESDGLFDGSGLSLADVGETAQGLEATFLDVRAEPVGSTFG